MALHWDDAGEAIRHREENDFYFGQPEKESEDDGEEEGEREEGDEG